MSALVVVDSLSLFLLGLEVHLMKEWYWSKKTANNKYALKCLLGAGVISLYFVVVKKVILLSFETERPDEEDPRILIPTEEEKIQRPDGSTIHVQHFGVKGKPAIILVHGWNSNRLQWFYQIQDFAGEHHVITMDLAGSGRSTRPKNNDYSLDKFAADLHAVIHTTRAMHPVLWGHSIGGMTVLTFYKLYQDQLPGIQAIVLQHTTYTNPLRTIIFSKYLKPIENIVLKPLCWLIVYLSPILWPFRWFSYYTGSLLIMTRILVFAGTQSSKQLDFISRLAAAVSPAVVARGIMGMFNYNATDVLQQINRPTLIIAANQDILTRPEASHLMKERIPGSKMVVMKTSAHMGLVENHALVNETVQEFLKEVTERAIPLRHDEEEAKDL